MIMPYGELMMKVVGGQSKLSKLMMNQTSLKRTTPCSATLDFSFRVLGGQSELSKLFLLTCLIITYVFNPMETSFVWNWT